MNIFLGIDTSNYTTSVAAIDENGKLTADERIVLEVATGNRGLRQSEAGFQHIKNLPILIKETIFKVRRSVDAADSFNITAIGVSDKPRRLKGSYMPVFLHGKSVASSISSVTGAPLFTYSHQEGHIGAIKYSMKKDINEFICFHNSGGTCEVLLVKPGKTSPYEVEIVGGSKDISIGQFIDRIGVSMGMQFPCGSQMDDLATSYFRDHECPIVKDRIKIDNLFFNLSGEETKIQREIEIYKEQNRFYENTIEYISANLFNKISFLIRELTDDIYNKYRLPIIYAGGVSESKYLREYIKNNFSAVSEDKVIFGNYSRDNAVGIAYLAMQDYKKI